MVHIITQHSCKGHVHVDIPQMVVMPFWLVKAAGTGTVVGRGPPRPFLGRLPPSLAAAIAASLAATSCSCFFSLHACQASAQQQQQQGKDARQPLWLACDVYEVMQDPTFQCMHQVLQSREFRFHLHMLARMITCTARAVSATSHIASFSCDDANWSQAQDQLTKCILSRRVLHVTCLVLSITFLAGQNQRS